MSTRIVVLSDLHAGSSVAPWPADCPLSDGGRWQPNVFQRYLNACWADMVSNLRALRPDVVVVNGDLVQGAHSDRDGQLVTSNPARQALAARMLLEPVADCCERLYVVRGTEWHEGKCSDSVEQLAEHLGAEQDASTGHYTWPALRLAIGGQVISIAHHVGTSSIPFYTATVPQRELLAEILEAALAYGREAPDVRCIVRSHRHRYVSVRPRPGFLAVVTPAWQYATAFGHKVAPALLPDIGYVVIESVRGVLVETPTVYPNPRPSVEVVA